MNVRFAPSLRAAAVLLVLVSPAFGQERAPAKGIPSLADFDDSIEALVRTVDPSIVQVFTSPAWRRCRVSSPINRVWSPRSARAAQASLSTRKVTS